MNKLIKEGKKKLKVFVRHVWIASFFLFSPLQLLYVEKKMHALFICGKNTISTIIFIVMNKGSNILPLVII